MDKKCLVVLATATFTLTACYSNLEASYAK